MKKGILLAAFFALFAFTGGVVAYNQYVATRFGDTRVTDLLLDGNDILDSNQVTRITVGSTNIITGDLSVSGTNYFTVAMSSAPRDLSSSIGITPAGIGQLVFNRTDSELCFSTGSTRFTWVRVSTPTIACAH